MLMKSTVVFADHLQENKTSHQSMNRKFPHPPRPAYVSHVVHHFLKRQNSVEYAAQVKIALSGPIHGNTNPPRLLW
jgi:hypothetical protein